MTTFESSIKVIPFNQETVYNKISDLNNLEQVKDRIPQDKIQDFKFDTDSINFSVSPMGSVCLRIIEREPCKCIKFEGDHSPIPLNLWVQLLPVTSEQAKLKVTIRAEVNMFKGNGIKALAGRCRKIGRNVGHDSLLI